MLNLRVSTDAICLSKLLQHKAFSSTGYSEKTYRKLLKHVTNQDKIKTDKFRKLVSYLSERNSHVTAYKGVERFSIYTDRNDSPGTVTIQRQYSNEITNVLDSSPQPEKSTPRTPDAEGAAKDTERLKDKDAPQGNEEVEAAFKGPDEKVTEEVSDLGPAGGQHKNQGSQADLSSAALPLSLHRSDSNILTAALVQDLNNIYVRAMESLDKQLVVAQERGLVLYNTLEHYRTHPEVLREWARRQTLTLEGIRDKSAVWWCEAKSAVSTPSPSTTTPTTQPAKTAEPSPFDKLKKAVEGLVAALKRKMEERKKAADEKKK